MEAPATVMFGEIDVITGIGSAVKVLVEVAVFTPTVTEIDPVKAPMGT